MTRLLLGLGLSFVLYALSTNVESGPRFAVACCPHQGKKKSMNKYVHGKGINKWHKVQLSRKFCSYLIRAGHFIKEQKKCFFNGIFWSGLDRGQLCPLLNLLVFDQGVNNSSIGLVTAARVRVRNGLDVYLAVLEHKKVLITNGSFFGPFTKM